MFPLSPPSIMTLLMVAAGLVSAVSCWRVGWLQRAALLVVAAALPVGFLAFFPPQGELAGLEQIFTLFLFAGAIVAGGLVGLILRMLPPQAAVAVMGIGVLSGGGFELWRQYVPPGCGSQPLRVTLAGMPFDVPVDMEPLLGRSSGFLTFGRHDRKHDFATVCRETGNGVRALAVNSVWITPKTHAARVAATCSAPAPPNWCGGYDAEKYSQIAQITLSADDADFAPGSYWDAEGLQTVQHGTLEEGSLCLASETGGPPFCWAWAPLAADAFRISASTTYDPRRSTTVEQSLGTLDAVLAMVRGMIQP